MRMSPFARRHPDRMGVEPDSRLFTAVQCGQVSISWWLVRAGRERIGKSHGRCRTRRAGEEDGLPDQPGRLSSSWIGVLVRSFPATAITMISTDPPPRQTRLADKIRSSLRESCAEIPRTGTSRRTALKTLIVASLAAIACLLTIVWRPPPLLLWNASSSVPRGLYLVFPGTRARRGDLVVAWLPRAARTLAAKRGYLPAGVPILKPVAATGGTRVCAHGREIRIDGRVAAVRKWADLKGRALPHWNGCTRLRVDQVFLLSRNPWSFDGRYFGPVRKSQIAGRVVHPWWG